MENLDKSWEKLSQSLEAEGHISREDILHDLRAESKQPLHMLIRNVKLKLYFSLGFAPFFILVAFFVKPLAVKLFMLAISLAYLIGGYYIYKGFKRIKDGVDLDKPSLEAIRLTKAAVHDVLRYELIFFIATFPISLTGGFLAGLSAESGNLDLLFEKTFVIWVLVGCYILFFPLGYYFSKWANKKHFGQYLQQLEDILQAAEKQENGFRNTN